VAEDHLDTARKLMHTLGIEGERLRLEVIASGERGKLTRVLRRFAGQMSKLDPNPLSG
jgi:coenzyme F420-reducing hydrogenase delta subunit